MGHVIFKSDNESPIAVVRDALARYHGGKVVIDKPPPHESQSNGSIEEAGKTVREFAKVLRDAVECKAKIKLTGEDAIVYWMIRWAAMLPSRYLVGQDGMTAYERRRGRRCRLPLAEFGETVWYKKTSKHKVGNKMEAKWESGVWLGHTRDSNEVIIGTAESSIRAYAVKRMAADERWNADNIKNMKGVPQQPDPKRTGIRVPIRITLGEEMAEVEPREVQKDAEPLPRRMGITMVELEKYGYTEIVLDAQPSDVAQWQRKGTRKPAGIE